MVKKYPNKPNLHESNICSIILSSVAEAFDLFVLFNFILLVSQNLVHFTQRGVLSVDLWKHISSLLLLHHSPYLRLIV